MLIYNGPSCSDDFGSGHWDWHPHVGCVGLAVGQYGLWVVAVVCVEDRFLAVAEWVPLSGSRQKLDGFPFGRDRRLSPTSQLGR